MVKEEKWRLEAERRKQEKEGRGPKTTQSGVEGSQLRTTGRREEQRKSGKSGRRRKQSKNEGSSDFRRARAGIEDTKERTA